MDIFVVKRPGTSSAASNGSSPSDGRGTGRYIFLHIPKTGGQTLHNLFDREYRGQYAFDTQIGVLTGDRVAVIEKRLRGMSPEELGQYRLIKGHMRFGAHEGLCLNYRYVTLMREPIERVISHYYYVKGIPEHPMNPVVRDRNLSLEDFVQEHAPMLSNVQTRLIAGVDLEMPSESCGRHTLEAAKRNIENHFALVGLTERFDETLLLFNRLLGWRTHFYVRKNVNLTRARQYELSPGALRIAQEANALDMELYQFANARFEELMNQFGAPFERDLKTYQRVNRWHGHLHRFRNGVKRALGLKVLGEPGKRQQDLL